MTPEHYFIVVGLAGEVEGRTSAKAKGHIVRHLFISTVLHPRTNPHQILLPRHELALLAAPLEDDGDCTVSAAGRARDNCPYYHSGSIRWKIAAALRCCCGSGFLGSPAIQSSAVHTLSKVAADSVSGQ